jgi:3-methyladenine DNA glycosylase AlkD
VAILCQLGARARTDPVLLADCIAPNLGDRAFFIRKAIGWALRDYARTDPAWVLAFVHASGDRLSQLSRREATKHLSGRGHRPAGDGQLPPSVPAHHVPPPAAPRASSGLSR